MFLTLLRLRLSALFASLFTGEKKRRSIPMLILVGILFLYLAAGLIAFTFFLFYVIGGALLSAGAEEVYFGIGGALILVIMLLGSIVCTKNQLYVASDNELLLSMPIPPSTILLCRLSALLIIDYLLEALVALPLLVVWLILGSVTLPSLLALLFSLLLLPPIALAVSSLLGYLLARISARIRKKQLVVLLFSLLFLAVYFPLVSGMEAFLDTLAADVTPLIDFVRAVPPLLCLGYAMKGSLLHLLLFFLPAILFTLLVFRVLARTYLTVVLENRGERRVAYRSKKQKVSSPLLALLRREVLHLLSSAGYMLNTGLGLLFLIAIPAFILIEGNLLPALETELGAVLFRLLPSALTAASLFALSTVTFASVTVSLEGASLWVVRTSPVPTRKILLSKLLFPLVPSAPFLLAAGILNAVVARASFPEALAMLLLTASFLLFSSALGLLSNLLFPKLVFQNEMVAIKQSLSPLLSMLASALSALLFGGAGLALSLLLPTAIALLLVALLCLAATAALLVLLSGFGVRRFEALTV